MTANYFISKEYFDPNDLYNIENTTKYKKDLIINKLDSQFYIVKYNKLYKKQLNSTAKLFRSVVFKHDKCVCFSPPKSLSIDNFRKNHKIRDVKIEEFIDGTMINLFYDETYNWQICTKSTIGANSNFNLDSNYTYREMFIDAMKKVNLNLDYLDIRFCYSFIMQHPNNRNVSVCISPLLYLVAAYEIINSNKGILIEELDIHNYYKNNEDKNNLLNNHIHNRNHIHSHAHNHIHSHAHNQDDINKYYFLNNNTFFNKYQLINQSVLYSDYNYKDRYIDELLLSTNNQLRIPIIYDKKYYNEYDNYRKIIRKYSATNKSPPFYSHMGIVLKCGNDRTKIRNPLYDEVKSMKGNDRHIKNTYLRLRKQHQIKKYLRYFPEHSEIFSELNNKIKEITNQLYAVYLDCFVKKNIKLKNQENQFKNHIYNLHKLYIEKLRPEYKKIDLFAVINYVNNLELYKLRNLMDY